MGTPNNENQKKKVSPKSNNPLGGIKKEMNAKVLGKNFFGGGRKVKRLGLETCNLNWQTKPLKLGLFFWKKRKWKCGLGRKEGKPPNLAECWEMGCLKLWPQKSFGGLWKPNPLATGKMNEDWLETSQKEGEIPSCRNETLGMKKNEPVFNWRNFEGKPCWNWKCEKNSGGMGLTWP